MAGSFRRSNRQSRQQEDGAAHSMASQVVAIHDGSRSPFLAGGWLSTSDLAGCLHVDASTLRRWRTARPPQGPPFVSVSERVVMYSALDVEEWLRSRRTVPGREA
ncbi:helix-turn-helix transcriptional regulator [Streptomyces bauhiniae]|uniref:helix-turn-helix transcriptional regulator n=1 Tax=Streptomyces bauhiniae TaxID=2340725 RepID=UPI003657BA35